MRLNHNSFYPFGPNQPNNDEDMSLQNDARIFPGQGGGIPGGMFPGQGGGIPGGMFPGQGGGFPGGMFPGQGGGFPGGFFPGGGQQGGGAPTSPPPSFTPQEPQASVYAVDPGGIRRCLFRYTYIWLTNGRSFWFYPIFVGRNSVAGYRWRRRYGWVYFGIDLNMIRSFQCN